MTGNAHVVLVGRRKVAHVVVAVARAEKEGAKAGVFSIHSGGVQFSPTATPSSASA